MFRKCSCRHVLKCRAAEAGSFEKAHTHNLDALLHLASLVSLQGSASALGMNTQPPEPVEQAGGFSAVISPPCSTVIWHLSEQPRDQGAIPAVLMCYGNSIGWKSTLAYPLWRYNACQNVFELQTILLLSPSCLRSLQGINTYRFMDRIMSVPSFTKKYFYGHFCQCYYITGITLWHGMSWKWSLY